MRIAQHVRHISWPSTVSSQHEGHDQIVTSEYFTGSVLITKLEYRTCPAT